MDAIIQTITVVILPLIFAITLPEALRGYAARYLGDRTAEMEGRLSLNPARHIDPLGTIVMPILTIALTSGLGAGLILGWAKPVPVRYGAMRDPKRGLRLVALASLGANLAMAVVWAMILRILISAGVAEPFFMQVAQAGVFINAVFFIIMLISLPPYPGGMVLFSLLSPRQAEQLARIEPYTNYIVIGLIITGILGRLLGPLIRLVMVLILALFGIQA